MEQRSEEITKKGIGGAEVEVHGLDFDRILGRLILREPVVLIPAGIDSAKGPSRFPGGKDAVGNGRIKSIGAEIDEFIECKRIVQDELSQMDKFAWPLRCFFSEVSGIPFKDIRLVSTQLVLAWLQVVYFCRDDSLCLPLSGSRSHHRCRARDTQQQHRDKERESMHSVRHLVVTPLNLGHSVASSG